MYEKEKMVVTKKTLRKRLMEAYSCLYHETKKLFKGGKFDFDGRRLVSPDGRLALQWRDTEETRGQVSIENLRMGGR